MHMADALLSPAVGATFWAGTLGTIAFCTRNLKSAMDERLVPLMGVLGAFIFAAQMINFTIPGTGASGHLGGGLLLAVILGPYAAFIVMASVLTVQAFFFADGGLLALGCNIWNLGIYPCFIAYPLIYKPILRSGNTSRMITMASVTGAVAGLQLGAFSVVLQTLLSGQSDLPFRAFTLAMQPVHLAIGLVEGIATAGVINFVRAARPEILESTVSEKSLPAGISPRKVVVGLLAAALLAGGMLSWFASVNPDGLEWSIEKVAGSAGLRAKKPDPSARSIQEKTAFLPDYEFRKSGEVPPAAQTSASRPFADPGRSASGILGSGMVLAVILLAGLAIRAARRKPN